MKSIMILSILVIVIIYIYNKSCVSKGDVKRIQSLLRQSARYGVAALQDNNSAIAVLHGDYSAAYLYALLDVYTEDEIKSAVDINLLEFKKGVQNVQAQVTKRLYEVCPKIVPKESSRLLVEASQLGV